MWKMMPTSGVVVIPLKRQKRLCRPLRWPHVYHHPPDEKTDPLAISSIFRSKYHIKLGFLHIYIYWLYRCERPTMNSFIVLRFPHAFCIAVCLSKGIWVYAHDTLWQSLTTWVTEYHPCIDDVPSYKTSIYRGISQFATFDCRNIPTISPWLLVKFLI